MKVRATQRGFYGNSLREPGDVFDVQHEQHFSSRWMAKVFDVKPSTSAGPSFSPRQPTALSADQSWFLSVVACEWLKTGRWPSENLLAVACDESGKDYDTLIRELAGLVVVEDLKPQACRLTLQGLARSRPADPVIAAFLALVQRGAREMRNNPRSWATLTRQHLAELLGPSQAHLLNHASQVALGEHAWWTQGTGSAPAEYWERQAGRSIIKYLQVSTIDDYLRIRLDRRGDGDVCTQSHYEMLRSLYRVWSGSGRWPRVADLLLQAHDPAEAYRVLQDLKGNYTHESVLHDPTNDDPVELLFPQGLEACGIAADDLLACAHVLRGMAAHFVATKGQGPATAQDISRLSGLSIENVQREAMLLRRNLLLPVRFEGGERAWTAAMQKDIRHFKDVNSWEDVRSTLARVAGEPREHPLEVTPPLSPTATSSPTPARWEEAGPGRVLGSRFALKAKIGEGSSGDVYEADDLHLKYAVAVKVLPRALAEDNDGLRRFIREARAIAGYSHSAIVHVYDVDTEGPTPYIAMELVRGRPFDVFVASEPQIRERLRLLRQVVDGMIHAHARRTLHRDLSPNNVLVTDDGAAKIIDFGWVKDQGASTFTQSNEGGFGTRNYVSPEQMASSKNVDHRTDIYSVGCLFYLATTGEHPTVRPIRIANPRLTAKCEQFFNKCTDKDPEARYADMKSTLSALDDVMQELGTAS